MANRYNKIKEDFEAVVNHCTKLSECPFGDFELGDHFCLYTFKDGTAEKSYRVHFTDDYPASSLLTIEEKSKGGSTTSSAKHTSDRLPVIFTKIAEDLKLHIRIAVPPDRPEPHERREEDDNNNREQDHIAAERNASSDYSYNSEDNWSDDYDNYYDSDMDSSAVHGPEMNTLLEQDMDNLLSVYGEESMTYRSFDSIDDIDIELHLPLDFFDPEIAKAWKMICQEPIIVRLHFSRSCYLDATQPKVEVFQPSHKDTKEKFGVGQQMTKIIEAFLSNYWKDLGNEFVRKQSQVAPSKNSQPPRKKRYQTQLSTSSTDGKLKSKEEDKSPSSPSTVNDRALAEIINMGFNTDEARNALVICRGEVQEAVNLLVANPESCTTAHEVQVEASASTSSSLVKPTRGKGSKKVHKQHSQPAVVSPSTSEHGFAKSFSSFVSSLIPGSSKSVQNPKDIPSLQYGFLVQIMQYTRQRLPTLNEYCVICDKRHLFQNGAMLKPAVCGGELCVFSFQTLGVMSDAAEDIATGAEVVDLLVAMATAACKSTRRDVIFDPYPTVIDPSRPTELAFCPKKKEYTLIEKCLDAFLSVTDMTRLDATGLKKAMDKNNVLAYPLLQWIINSNRSHIVKLPKQKRVSFMHTEHQFLLMSSPPAKEAAFREAKSRHGSTFAFHGSHIENWHSILRVGLVNASGTKYQMHGAAYGKGIYLSPKAHVSFGYSGSNFRAGNPSKPPASGSAENKPSNRFLNRKNLTCIALCEVVCSSDLKKSGDIWVCPDSDHVCTRFFFVYEHGISGDTGIDTQLEKYKKEIQGAMEFSYR